MNRRHHLGASSWWKWRATKLNKELARHKTKNNKSFNIKLPGGLPEDAWIWNFYVERLVVFLPLNLSQTTCFFFIFFYFLFHSFLLVGRAGPHPRRIRQRSRQKCSICTRRQQHAARRTAKPEPQIREHVLSLTDRVIGARTMYCYLLLL